MGPWDERVPELVYDSAVAPVFEASRSRNTASSIASAEPQRIIVDVTTVTGGGLPSTNLPKPL